MDGSTWSAIDGRIDAVLTAIRDPDPDPSVETKVRDDLEIALKMSAGQFRSRPVRITVADQRAAGVCRLRPQGSSDCRDPLGGVIEVSLGVTFHGFPCITFH